MKRVISRLVVLSVAALNCGCSGGTVSTMQGVTFELPASNSLSYSDTHNEASIRSGSLNVALTKGQLKVNAKSYGEVKKGDRVKIDESAIVTVNGTVRNPK